MYPQICNEARISAAATDQNGPGDDGVTRFPSPKQLLHSLHSARFQSNMKLTQTDQSRLCTARVRMRTPLSLGSRSQWPQAFCAQPPIPSACNAKYSSEESALQLEVTTLANPGSRGTVLHTLREKNLLPLTKVGTTRHNFSFPTAEPQNDGKTPALHTLWCAATFPTQQTPFVHPSKLTLCPTWYTSIFNLSLLLKVTATNTSVYRTVSCKRRSQVQDTPQDLVLFSGTKVH